MSLPAAGLAPAPSRPFRALLAHRSFMLLLAARMTSRFGDSIDSIAYSWMVYQLTGSKLMMGSLFALNFVPGILFSLFIGVLIDRIPQKTILVASYAARGLSVAATAALLGLGLLEPWHLFVFTFLNSTLECFATPTETSLVPRLLPKPLLLSGNSLSASLAQRGAGRSGSRRRDHRLDGTRRRYPCRRLDLSPLRAPSALPSRSSSA